MFTNILQRVNFDTNKCKPQKNFVWCLPKDYNLEKHPFSCKSKLIFKHHSILIILFEVFHLQNKSLPWDYQFKFVIDEISNINDKTQSMMVSMYFQVSWLEPRLQINESAQEWIEDRTGPKDVRSLGARGGIQCLIY